MPGNDTKSGSPNGPVVRRATPADLPVICRLGAPLVEEHYGFDPRRFLAARTGTPRWSFSGRGAARVVSSTAERNEAAQRLFAGAGFRRTMIEMTASWMTPPPDCADQPPACRDLNTKLGPAELMYHQERYASSVRAADTVDGI